MNDTREVTVYLGNVDQVFYLAAVFDYPAKIFCLCPPYWMKDLNEAPSETEATRQT